MITLPDSFIKEIQAVFGKEDADTYMALFEKEAFRGISVNRLKTTPEKLLALLPYHVTASPFYTDGFYLNGDTAGIGKHPLHHAGAFYVQEPSATSAVTMLNVQPGEKILDLCAAPGGKSAQIASCLGGKGLLWSNELVRNRAQILLSNDERMGIPNGVVSSCYPDKLCERLSGFFDKVLVDAPCSGEGMFRKNPEAVTEWSREHVAACAERQLSILDSAAKAVTEGGELVYSTCTFSYEENEGVITAFLESHPEFEAVSLREHFGRPSGVSCGVRITPLEGGEGHFAARMRRKGEKKSPVSVSVSARKAPKSAELAAAERELGGILTKMPEGKLVMIGDKVYLWPNGLPETGGTGVIRAGVLMGELKKNRFEPAHAMFMALPVNSFQRVLDLSLEDPRTEAFLKGYEIDCETGSGYTAVAVCGITLGFGKCSSGRLKNKYPKGLRI